MSIVSNVINKKLTLNSRTKIFYGKSKIKEFIKTISQHELIIVVCTKGFLSRDRSLLNNILKNKKFFLFNDIQQNPDINSLIKSLSSLSSYKFSLIISIGGGSVIDTGKFIKIYISKSLKKSLNGDYFLNKKISDKIIHACIPTTMGTGSELTRFATLWDNLGKRKLSFEDNNLQPNYAYLDLDFVINLPVFFIVSTGLDAISQCLESLWSKKNSSVTSSIAIESIIMGLKMLPFAITKNPNAMKKMQIVSTISGYLINITRTAAAHSISYPLTSYYSIPHGIAVAFTIRDIFIINYNSDKTRFIPLLKKLNLKDGSDFIKLIDDLFLKINYHEIVKKFLPDSEEIIKLIPLMYTKGRSDNNMIELNDNDLKNIINNSYKRIFDNV